MKLRLIILTFLISLAIYPAFGLDFRALFQDTLSYGRKQDIALDLARCAVLHEKLGKRDKSIAMMGLAEKQHKKVARNAAHVARRERGFMKDANTHAAACDALYETVKTGGKKLK